jgi:diadenosine tetraphosphatase ApaH/serine/threonine PP2A family protein phosphatase
VDLVRKTVACCVKGNFDEYCSNELPLTGYSESAAKEIKWTRSKLTGADRSWLSSLPYTASMDGFTLAHATLDAPQRWRYVFDKLAAAASFPHQNTALCFFGHTHVPLAFIRESTGSDAPVIKSGTYHKFSIEPPRKYFVNPGSVGQPRDNNPMAAYVVYDKDAETIELRRVEYDIASAQNCIRNRN